MTSMAQCRISATGLSVLYEAENPVADIVFIHGLQGNPYRTWLWKGKSRSSSQDSHRSSLSSPPSLSILDIAKSPNSSIDGNSTSSGIKNFTSSISRGFKKLVGPSTKVSQRRAREAITPSHTFLQQIDSRRAHEVYWPLDLLPKDCPDTRILTWGYDSKITKWLDGPTNKNNLVSHAQDFLCAFSTQREISRPIIFVVHSLGGLVVKEILRQSDAAKEDDDYLDIVQSTHTVVFFGTPHRGSASNAAIGEFVRRAASGILRVDSNPSLLRALSDSPEVQIGRQEFTRIRRRHRIEVKTFQEAFGVFGANVGILNTKVVPDISSSLDDPEEHKETIQANHRDMCRFSQFDDPEYKKVARTMGGIVKTVVARGRKRRDDCLKNIHFQALGMRRINTPDALIGTCDWALQSPEYQAWVDRKDVNVHHGLLCVKGGPGSGKSVLMKEAFKRASRDITGKRTVVDFFFNGRGGKLDTSPLGLYRALIYEMIMQDEIFSTMMMVEYEKKYERQHGEAGHPHSDIQWDEKELKDILELAAASGSLQPTQIFIDALDECDTMRLRDVIGFFRSLADIAFFSGWPLDICLSCRHFPVVSLGPCLEIVMEHGNDTDIARYLRSRLRQATARKDLKRVEFETLKRARGNFFWVSLVSDLLLQDLDNGKTLRDIFATLEAVPKDLESLFADMFQRLKPHERSQSVALFQLVFMARWPLTPLEVCLMLGFTRQHRSLLEWESSIDAVDNHDQAMSLIRSLSCGLIGFRHTSQSLCGTVEFVHESVRQYLCNGAFGHLAKDKNMTNEQIALGHGAMTNICMNLLLIKELNPAKRDLPMIYKHHGSLYFAAANLLRLLKILDGAGAGFDIILRTISSRRSDLWKRLRWLLDLKRVSHHLHHTLIWHKTISDELLQCETLLQAVCYLQLSTLATRLLQNGDDPNEAPGFSVAPLVLAIQKDRNSAQVVHTLLKYGAIVNAYDRRGRSALHLAARLGLIPVVEILLSSGAELKGRDRECSTPLHLAVCHGHHEVAKRLLRRGADPDVWWERLTPDGRYTEWSPLHIAVLQNDVTMVKILVQEMACLEIFDNGNRLPYDLAVSLGYKNIETFIWQAMIREGISEQTQSHLRGKKLDEEIEYIADPLSEIPDFT